VKNEKVVELEIRCFWVERRNFGSVGESVRLYRRGRNCSSMR